MSNIPVSMIPGGIHPEINVSKGDSREVTLELDEVFTSTDTITLQVKLPNDTYEVIEIEHTSGNLLTFTIGTDITEVAGTCLSKINITNQTQTKSISSELILIVVEDL